MSEKDAPAVPVEAIPSVQVGLSGLASAAAPFLYFIKVTLTATRDLPQANNKIASDHVVVAHLRMNMAAARALKAALEGAILLASPSPSDTPN
jgi:hypothetical protein